MENFSTLHAASELQKDVFNLRALRNNVEMKLRIAQDANEGSALDGKPALFSAKALEDIKAIVDQCLRLYWKVEAAIMNNSESKLLDQEIATKLAIFNDEIKAKKSSKLLQLNTNLVLTRLECLRWPYVAPRLEQYGLQLNGLQFNLMLIFQVISVRAKTAAP